MNQNRMYIAIATILLIIIAIIALCPFKIVDTGYRGIKITLGKVSPVSLTEGVHFKFPIFQNIVLMDVRTKKLAIDTSVYTKDIQQATINYTINYNLDASSVHDMYREVGVAWEEKILMPAVEGILKNVIGKWNASELVANRDKATSEILFLLKRDLEKNHVDVTNFQIAHIKYTSEFERAIEAKVTAEQEALKAKNKTVQIQEEAKQKIISAEAEAKSMAIRATALTQNKALVEYEAVQKWNGKLPEYLMGGTMPFINLPVKK